MLARGMRAARTLFKATMSMCHLCSTALRSFVFYLFFVVSVSFFWRVFFFLVAHVSQQIHLSICCSTQRVAMVGEYNFITKKKTIVAAITPFFRCAIRERILLVSARCSLLFGYVPVMFPWSSSPFTHKHTRTSKGSLPFLLLCSGRIHQQHARPVRRNMILGSSDAWSSSAPCIVIILAG